MVTTDARLSNGTMEPHGNGIEEETFPVVNHTVFPTASIDIELPSAISQKIAATSVGSTGGIASDTISVPQIPTESCTATPVTTPSQVPALLVETAPENASAPTISISSLTTHIQKGPITPTISVDSPTTTELKTASFHSKQAEDELLFSTDLVSPAIAAQLPPTYTIRPLKKSDYANGFLDCLRVLTVVGDITEQEFNERYEFLRTQGKGGYYLLVIEERGRVVGTGALIVERKLYVFLHSLGWSCVRPKLTIRYSIHHLGLVGHIEDIAVAEDQQGKKLGKKLIQALDFIAEKVGCYKTILDCSEANEGFYIKCGFKKAGLEMAHYYEKQKST
jgi:glucosamine-phosphate N-acetyltransferase